ncbi:hypothetical protein [Flavobacterium capsici]|uniref:Peptidase C39-like domain-containing protein n=1 Tax=Flavobacterium capsici TaxID=3075618 RepID=A0AA96J328_9FLAO|nr:MULTISPECIES: hypothetical protein [unclassified Flavobacterium]WNM19770.1 hypothetical protein RN608_03590 [Flavobacterium sp. PMR2A8]WNM21159.1 hypothetical protein RN605_10760 [Flavobacterium sp. PMTSA4]
MKPFRFKQLLLNLLALAAMATTSAQISISNTDELAKIKDGTTYIAMKDPASPKAAAFVAAAKKYWTFSKIECIAYKEVEQHIQPNASFITIGGKMSSSNSPTANTETRVFLELWTTNGKYTYDSKKRRHFNQADKISLATFELFPDYLTQANPSSLYRIDYDASGHLKNWGDGVFGNMLQMLCTSLTVGQVREYKEEFMDTNEVKALASTTLYLPDYVLTKFSKNSGDESKKYEEKELLADYPFSYKVVSIEELNTKINTSDTNIYYLLLIKSGNDHFVTVTNSKTGLIVYSNFSGSGFNLKASDLKTLAKAAGK